MTTKRLFLPIEIKKREFDAKLLLAFFALEKGMEVYIGRQPEILKGMIFFNRSIFFEKGLTILNLEQIRYLDNLGHNVVATCEEGLIYNDDEFYLKRRISKKALDLVEIFFAWGSKQAKLIKNYSYKNKNKIIDSGNPRIDLLQKKILKLKYDESIEIRNKYKKFILINSNFSIYNNKNGKNFYLEKMIWARGDVDTSHEKQCREYYNYQMHNFFSYVELIKKLVRDFKDYKIILRPHPSENISEWKRICSKISERVLVTNEKNFIAWSIASKYIIQCRCMTGLESFIISKENVINYEPHTLSFSKNITNEIGYQCDTYEKIRSIIKRNPKTYLDPESKIKNLITSEKSLSASVIIDHIVNYKFKEKKKKYTYFILLILKRLTSKGLNLFKEKKKDPWDDKFKSLTVYEVELFLKKISLIFKKTPKFIIKESFFSDKCIKIKRYE